MRRTLRMLRRVLLGLGAGLGLVLLVTLDGVDDRPYFRESYYEVTTARLQSVTMTNRVEEGDLWAGFGRAVLTPAVGASEDDPEQGRFRGLPLAGYGSRKGRWAEGVHDDLYVKAVAVRVGDQTGVMVGADALIIPPEVAEMASSQLRDELGLGREQIYLGATHTHCGFGGWGEGMVAEAFAGEYQPGARVWFANRLVAAVREAVNDLQPARMGHGRVMSREFVRNRLVGSLGRVDPEFSFILLRQEDGGQAVVGSYAAHATVLPADMMEFSGDYPGYWQRVLETETGGVALFLAGAVGSHGPVPGEKGMGGAERMGRSLAMAIARALPETPLTNRVALGILGLELDLPPLNVRVTDGVRLRPWLARRLVRPAEGCWLQVLRLGTVYWMSTPCDYSGELALSMKDHLRSRGADAVVTSFNGGYVGYVLPEHYYHMKGYEPRVMSFFGPYVPAYFDEMLRRMLVGLGVDGSEGVSRVGGP